MKLGWSVKPHFWTRHQKLSWNDHEMCGLKSTCGENKQTYPEHPGCVDCEVSGVDPTVALVTWLSEDQRLRLLGHHVDVERAGARSVHVVPERERARRSASGQVGRVDASGVAGGARRWRLDVQVVACTDQAGSIFTLFFFVLFMVFVTITCTNTEIELAANCEDKHQGTG